jgi:hypothetical protein
VPSALVDWNNNYGDDDDRCVLFHCGNWPVAYAEGAQIGTAPILGSTLGEENTWGALHGRTPAGPCTFARIGTDDTRGALRAYVGEGAFTDDPLDTFGCRAVVRIPRQRDRLARPRMAFCSCNMAGTPARLAASRGGTVGYPPKPMMMSGRIFCISRPDARMPDKIRHAMRRIATGFFPVIVAEGMTVTLLAGKPALNRSARRSVARCTSQPLEMSSCASASAGNRCPPVPPALRSAVLAVSAVMLFRRGEGPERQAANVLAQAFRPAPVERQHETHGNGGRQQRGAAIGDEGKCHSLCRDHLQGHHQPGRDAPSPPPPTPV